MMNELRPDSSCEKEKTRPLQTPKKTNDLTQKEQFF